MSRNPFLVMLDNENDEEAVRSRLAAPHGYKESYKAFAKEWLREKEDARKGAALSRSEERDTKALSIAQDANDIALKAQASSRIANTIALVSIIISIIAIFVSIFNK